MMIGNIYLYSNVCANKKNGKRQQDHLKIYIYLKSQIIYQGAGIFCAYFLADLYMVVSFFHIFHFIMDLSIYKFYFTLSKSTKNVFLGRYNVRSGGRGEGGGGRGTQVIYLILYCIIITNNTNNCGSCKNTPLGFEPTRECKTESALDHSANLLSQRNAVYRLITLSKRGGGKTAWVNIVMTGGGLLALLQVCPSQQHNCLREPIVNCSFLCMDFSFISHSPRGRQKFHKLSLSLTIKFQRNTARKLYYL
jgi:hypothetical protein